jgi:hypothetical protein
MTLKRADDRDEFITELKRIIKKNNDYKGSTECSKCNYNKSMAGNTIILSVLFVITMYFWGKYT